MSIKVDSSLRTRLKSVLIFAPVVIAILVFGGPAFTLMMAAGAGVGAWEWVRMVTTGQHPPRYLAHVATVLTALAAATAGMVSCLTPSESKATSFTYQTGR